MQAILNIELDEKAGPGLDVHARYENVMRAVRRFFTQAVGEISVAEYTAPSGYVQEHTAVVVFEFHSRKEVVLQCVWQLSRAFNQDCVAVLFGDGEGRLVGPEADRWGPFNIGFFKRPAILELFREAA